MQDHSSSHSAIMESSEDDELIRLVSSGSNSANQFVVFQNGYGRLYAINVAKVEELIIFNEIRLIRNSDSQALALGTAKIRSHLMPIINFDRWLGLEPKSDDAYELLILCYYGHCRFGIVIGSVAGIYNIDSADLMDNSDRDPKSSYVTEVTIHSNKELCLVFDSERLLVDLFPELQGQHEQELKSVRQESRRDDTLVLLAEDSRIIQKKLTQLLDKMGLRTKIFADGKQLWDWLNTHGDEKVDIIISDIEMPVMDGIELLKKIRSHNRYKVIPILMHTNMANPAIIKAAYEYGADDVVKKIDFATLEESINKHIWPN